MTIPIAFVTTRHRCPHCRKSYAHAATATRHMERCFTNPDVRSCKTCRHYSMDVESGPHCDEGHELNQASCSQCGSEIDPREGLCPAEHFVKPLIGMRVQCDQWAREEVS